MSPLHDASLYHNTIPSDGRAAVRRGPASPPRQPHRGADSRTAVEWVLRTALPLRPDFGIWLNSTKLVPSKQGKGLLKKWVLGRDMVALPRPGPKDVSTYEDTNAEKDSERRFGLEVPGLGRVSGYAEAYKEIPDGKI